MKKVLIAILCFVLTVAVAGCGVQAKKEEWHEPTANTTAVDFMLPDDTIEHETRMAGSDRDLYLLPDGATTMEVYPHDMLASTVTTYLSNIAKKEKMGGVVLYDIVDIETDDTIYIDETEVQQLAFTYKDSGDEIHYKNTLLIPIGEPSGNDWDSTQYCVEITFYDRDDTEESKELFRKIIETMSINI